MSEYGVSLRHPDKWFQINQTDRGTHSRLFEEHLDSSGGSTYCKWITNAVISESELVTKNTHFYRHGYLC